MSFEDLTQFEKDYLNSLLELRLKEYDVQFKAICERYQSVDHRWKKNVGRLETKCDFVLKLREKLGFIKCEDKASLDEALGIVRDLEDRIKNGNARTN